MAVRVGDTVKPMNDLPFWVVMAENVGVEDQSLANVLRELSQTISDLGPLLEEIKSLVQNGGPTEEIIAKFDQAIFDVSKFSA